MLDSIRNALAEHRDVAALIAALPATLRCLFEFDYMSLFLEGAIASATGWYVPASEKPPVLALTPTRARPIEAMQAAWVLEHQQPAISSRLDEATRVQGALSLREQGFQSACAVPLTTSFRRLGSLHLAAKRPHVYCDESLPILSNVAHHVAVAIDSALMHAELQQEQDRRQVLLELTNAVMSNLDLREVLRAVMTASRRVLRSDSAVVALSDPGSGQLRVDALDSLGDGERFQEGELLRLDGTVPGHVFRTGTPWVGDGEDARRARLEVDAKWTAHGFTAVCVLPLISRHRVLGTLGLSRRDGHVYTQDDVQFLTQVASQIAMAVENALAYGEIRDLKDKLAQEKLYLENEIQCDRNFEEIIGASKALRRVLQQVETVAPTDSTVLICGETGTGKELIARAIHNLSRRSQQAFVKLNCAAIPTGLLESELFGHERGAFTGAIAQRIGRFELANRGTVFLDEIGDIPLELQPKLLRVLQEREFERLGSGRTLRSDARLIAATNADLGALVEAQKFRADLFYRLNVFPIQVPPLRERAEDIPLLVRHFVQHFARQMNRTIDTISSDTMERLTRYPWPGNIRELENLIERAVILSAGPALRVPLEDLPLRVVAGPVNRQASPRTLAEAERAHILATVKETKWVLSGPNGAARRLGMNRSTLQFRMKKLGILRPAM
ncbi:MAG TPA: sigma 54-interacting transcriptional regulator [Candidatus Methylomirabilis sp.]|nr:sigma 54-interacting transcriptional regulator [Candidatus Methylomirabilis sp.]